MKLVAIILAAGAGRRFGGGKLLAGYRGRPLVHHALLAADAACIEEIVVVVGADAEEVGRAVSACQVSHGVRTVLASDWRDGMSASLHAGCAAVGSDAAGAFVMLGDMPAIPAGIFAPLEAAVAAGAPAAAPVCDGVRGHPVLLGRDLIDRVGEVRGDAGARALLGSAVLIPTKDRGVLFDIDKIADLGRR